MLAPSSESNTASVFAPRATIDADGTVEGYASLFGELDQARDMMMRGAFAETLSARGIRRVPMLFQHDPSEPVGIWLELREDHRGLFARGRLIPEVARGRELLSLLRAGAIDGLSIGFRTSKARIDPKTRIRRIYAVDLWEISIVTFPMLAGARVRAVKRSHVRTRAEQEWARAAGTPGAGGLVNGSPRSDPGAGGFHVGGEIAANGGSVVHGGSGNGAEGGRVDIELIPTDGALMVDQSGKITADGGKAGSGVAGGGGHIWLFTMDGDLTIAGSLSARGGEASDGTGGLGGMIYLFSDDNHNAVDVGKGNLLIAPSGVLNASGGDGNVGGDARNDGIMGQVAPFPEEQEKFAIFLNCDGQHGETRNWMDNQGMLIARGGAPNGNGGDITYHGIGPGQRDMPTDDSGNHHPPGGNQDMSGDGSGQAGDYGAE